MRQALQTVRRIMLCVIALVLAVEPVAASAVVRAAMPGAATGVSGAGGAPVTHAPAVETAGPGSTASAEGHGPGDCHGHHGKNASAAAETWQGDEAGVAQHADVAASKHPQLGCAGCGDRHHGCSSLCLLKCFSVLAVLPAATGEMHAQIGVLNRIEVALLLSWSARPPAPPPKA